MFRLTSSLTQLRLSIILEILENTSYVISNLYFYSANNAFRPNTFLHVIGDTPVDFLSDSRVELKVLVEVE